MGGRMWTDAELDFIKSNYEKMTNEEMASQLGRETNGVQSKVNRLGLKGDNNRKPRRRDTYKGERIKVGDKFGLLTVKEVLDTPGQTYCVCECQCSPGVTFSRSSGDLKNRDNHSCGCQKIEKAVARLTKHGKCNHPLYINWTSMRARCNNPNHEEYHNYGGRGITICEEWNDFDKYLEWADKTHEEGKTVHRIDNDLNYCPDNCVWATPLEQANNRNNNRLLTAFEENKTVSEWSRDSRATVCEMTIRYRIDNGWDDEKAISTPAGITPNRQGKPSTIKSGDVFGELTVVSTTLEIKGKQKSMRCKCVCSCGNETEKWANNIAYQAKNGVSPSCGCVKAQKAREKITAYNNR